MPKSKKPNILILWGDDIGWWNISYNSRGQMGYRTPNIDRVGNEGVAFTDYYGAAELHRRPRGLHHRPESDPYRADQGGHAGCRRRPAARRTRPSPNCSSRYGYATGQFGKNHLGDKDEFLPTMHGFDEFFGNLYHLNAEEEPEDPDYPKNPEFKKPFGPARRAALPGPTARAGKASRTPGH